MTWHALLVFAPLLAMLTWAAAVDLRRRRIPNWLTLLIAATGLMQSLTAYPTISFGGALLGLLTGLGLTIVLFALGALGGGDVKLLAAAGSWIGPLLVFEVFLAAAIIGMVIVLAQCAWQRRLTMLFRNSVLVVVNLAHIREVGLEHAQATGASCRSVSKPLPYAVPVLLAVVALLLAGGKLI
jgi:prepilin peptidase CpaA